jgi:hypothetical protein
MGHSSGSAVIAHAKLRFMAIERVRAIAGPAVRRNAKFGISNGTG